MRRDLIKVVEDEITEIGNGVLQVNDTLESLQVSSCGAHDQTLDTIAQTTR